MALILLPARAADPPIELPCEPSRACAIQMARAAGYEGERRASGNGALRAGLLGIVELEAASGDKVAYAATLAEIRRYVAGLKNPYDLLSSLTRIQAAAGLFEDAEATARDSRPGFDHEMAYRYLTEEYSRRGRWREALVAATEWTGKVEYAKPAVMKELVKTGRRDWVMDALQTLASGNEAPVLSVLERVTGNFLAAQAQAVRVQDPAERWMLLFDTATAAIEKQQWDAVIAVANFAAAEGVAAQEPHTRFHRLSFATEWLCAAGRYEEALALAPKVQRVEEEQLRYTVAESLVSAGETAKAKKLLKSISGDLKAALTERIAMAQVLEGKQRYEKALAPLRTPAARLAALQLLGEKLPESRRVEARDALHAAVKEAQQPGIENPDYELAVTGTLLAKRGFHADALEVANRIDARNGEFRAGNLCNIYGGIILAQAAQGDAAAARKTLARAGSVLLEPKVDDYVHAAFIADMARAGLLPEAFAQIQVLARRPYGNKWYWSDIEVVTRAHIEAGQLRRAFEIAALASDHERGNPYYFLDLVPALSK